MQTRMTIDPRGIPVLTHASARNTEGIRAVINAITKGGSNQFHGRGAYYLQDSKMDATNYFLKLAGATPARAA